MTITRYVVETYDLCEVGMTARTPLCSPMGSSPVCLDYASAIETARRMRRGYDAAGRDYLIIRILRQDKTLGTTVERYVYHL